MDDSLPPRPEFLPPGFGTVGHRDFVEIVVPETVPFTPQTSAWFFLVAVLLLALAWTLRRAIQRYRGNAYRRLALAELRILQQDLQKNRDQAVQQLPRLLKRAALGAFSRTDVAALSGQAWVDFMKGTAPGVLSDQAQTAFSLLGHLDARELPTSHDAELFFGAERWLRGHRV